jgi:NitT/TauT family transport system ATP-binding protein
VADITLDGVSVSYATREPPLRKVEVLRGFDLVVNEGEFVCIFGPNGCGKTTILNLIAGLLKPELGSVSVGGVPAGKARVSYVFQNAGDTLLPWRTSLSNLALPLEAHGVAASEALAKARSYVESEQVALPPKRFPYQLSGGQRQLLALHRALVCPPDVFLLDEPFSGFDYDVRTDMEDKLLSIWEKRRTATVFVSHEVEEAIYLSDRVIVLSRLPATVVADVRVPLSRPRRQEVVGTTAFADIQSQVLAAFRRGGQA